MRSLLVIYILLSTSTVLADDCNCDCNSNPYDRPVTYDEQRKLNQELSREIFNAGQHQAVINSIMNEPRRDHDHRRGDYVPFYRDSDTVPFLGDDDHFRSIDNN